MSFFQNQGSFTNLLKEGFRHYSGVEESILKNVDAVKELSAMTRTSLGPNGMNKFVVNQLDKVFLTKDSGTMLRELDINHPAAKIVVNASKIQEGEMGDNTNLVVTFAGELLNQAGELIKSGLHPSEILKGYELAFTQCISLLEEAPKFVLNDIKNVEEVSKVIKSAINSKVSYGQELILAPLIAQACINVLPSDPNRFNVDNIRVAKFLGSSLFESQVIKGLVVGRLVEGNVTSVENCKVAVFNCPIETQQAETKDTVLFKNADELLNYTRSEEDHLEKVIKEIVDSGVKAVIVGGSISDMAIHFFDKYKILVFRVMSKFELRRIAKAIGAAPLVRLGAPTREEMGEVDKICVDEIGSQKCIIISRDSDDNKLATILVRGSTNTFLDNIERVVSNGVYAYKSLCKNNVYVPGAGAIEMYLSLNIKNYAKTITGLEQYAVTKFGEAFEVVPRTLIENCGFNVNEIIANLNSASLKNSNSGINMKTGEIIDAFENAIYDHSETKRWAIKFSVDAVLTILRVDQIIVAKPAGGPKFDQKYRQNPENEEM